MSNRQPDNQSAVQDTYECTHNQNQNHNNTDSCYYCCQFQYHSVAEHSVWIVHVALQNPSRNKCLALGRSNQYEILTCVSFCTCKCFKQ